MTPDTWVCWKCGASLEGLPRPFGRREECPACRAELHVCRMCRHYDPRVSRACREPVAGEVKDKERANFCDWFQARQGAGPGSPGGSDASSRQALEALIGLGGDPGGVPADSRADPAAGGAPAPRDEAAAARAALERLFGGPPKGD